MTMPSGYRFVLVGVILAYLAVNLIVGLWAGKMEKKQTTGGFLRNYFIGGRSMGGIVLAMTLIATYTSASSFLSGPGLGSTRGLTQCLVAIIQVGTAFLTLGIIGKKFALISRKINAVSVSDFLRARYKSNTLVIITSLLMVVFFITNMVGQFVGGAVLFETLSGLPYMGGLLIFGVVVIVYCTFGGFKGVVTTDTIQGFVMTIGTVLIIVYAIKAGGGMESLSSWLDTNRPGWDVAGFNHTGINATGFITSYWVLVGIGTLGLPQNAVRGMGFKSTQAMHRAMIFGTFVVGFLMIGMHFGGALIGPTLEGAELASTDYYVPYFAINERPAGLAGLLLAAPLAAVMSTVSSLLILASASIIKDLYLHYMVKPEVDKESESFRKKLSRFSFFATFIIGVICLAFAIKPPSIITWINLYALGGLMCTFFWPIIGGLYYKKSNAKASLASAIFGVAAFAIGNQLRAAGLMPFEMHESVPGIVIGGIAFFIVAKLTYKPTDLTPEESFVFYGE